MMSYYNVKYHNELNVSAVFKWFTSFFYVMLSALVDLGSEVWSSKRGSGIMVASYNGLHVLSLKHIPIIVLLLIIVKDLKNTVCRTVLFISKRQL